MIQCCCDLDNWQPEPDTGHSTVCPIHKAVCDRHWIPVEKNPPLGVDVLIKNGEDIKIDKQYLHYEVNGRVLLPNDPRCNTVKPERRFLKYSNVTHWMELPK